MCPTQARPMDSSRRRHPTPNCAATCQHSASRLLTKRWPRRCAGSMTTTSRRASDHAKRCLCRLTQRDAFKQQHKQGNSSRRSHYHHLSRRASASRSYRKICARACLLLVAAGSSRSDVRQVTMTLAGARECRNWRSVWRASSWQACKKEQSVSILVKLGRARQH